MAKKGRASHHGPKSLDHAISFIKRHHLESLPSRCSQNFMLSPSVFSARGERKHRTFVNIQTFPQQLSFLRCCADRDVCNRSLAAQSRICWYLLIFTNKPVIHPKPECSRAKTAMYNQSNCLDGERESGET